MADLLFYFRWSAQTDTTWSPTFGVNDEHVFNFEIACDEGQIPKLTVEIINPRVGLLSLGRQYWAWFSVSGDGGATFVPLFFGRLIGIPQTILNNTIKCEFIARRPTYIQQKQLVAESLKVLPQYDPIFLDVQKRDDPDAILEGYSMLYAVDRVTGEVSVSDILIGEDGTITIDATATYYDSVEMKLQQSPLVAVNVKALVTWDQQYAGFFKVGQWSFPTLGNEPFVSDWPKSGQSIGGGYRGAVAWAGIQDPFVQVQTSSNFNYQYHWQNTARHHEEGDTMSVDIAFSLPTQPMSLIITEQFNQVGIINPYTVDAAGFPDPTNIPAISRWSAVGVRTFDIGYKSLAAIGTLALSYQANRSRTELVDVTVTADVQPILIDPLVTEDTETVTLKSGDLALPQINLLNWSSIAGGAVTLGTLIFPDNPLVAGQTSSQICVTAGTAGTVEPTFSNVAGVTTADGSVVWSSLGSTAPTEIAQDWQQFTRVALGAVILPKPIMDAPDRDAFVAAGGLNNPPMGVPVAKYTVLATNLGQPGDTMLEVTDAGIAGGSTAAQALFTDFINPSGRDLYIAVQAGTTGEYHTTFAETPGASTADGSVIWQNIGKVSLPIGGWPGMTPAASYFPSARGQLSLQHLLCRARAKLRRRARAVQVSFQCNMIPVLGISCRMNAAITDVRLPGGLGVGKVVSYRLKRDGDSGVSYAQITIGCSIGKGNAVNPTAPGTAVYADGVFNQGEVEVWAGAVISVTPTGDDIGYTPPVQQTVDDGLSFPVQGYGDVILSSVWHGAATEFAQATADYNAAVAAATADAIASAKVTKFPGGQSSGGTTSAPDLAAAMVSHINESVFQGTYLWYELCLKSLEGGPYAAAYVVDTTVLQLPKTIDLSASS